MRASSDNNGIGQPVRRREDFRLLTGKGCYSDDFNFEGQAYAVMVRSPHAHAIIRSVDTGAAAATTVAAAKDGAELVSVDYQPMPAVAHAPTAVEPDAPRARVEAPSNISIDAEIGDRGATDAAFAAAAHIVKLDTWVQRIAGVPMEPRAATGTYERDSQRYTLYAGIGGAVRPKQDLAKILGVGEDKVRVVMHDVGGNFGTRGSFNPEFALVTWAARHVGRPVKWTCERQEAFLCDYQARDLAVEAELALDGEGNFVAMRGSNISNVGAY